MESSNACRVIFRMMIKVVSARPGGSLFLNNPVQLGRDTMSVPFYGSQLFFLDVMQKVMICLKDLCFFVFLTPFLIRWVLPTAI